MDADVAIIGFGPAGATLAGLLGRNGLRTIVVERDAAVFPQPRAAHIDHTGLRTIQELGCLDQALPNMIRNRCLDLVNRDHEVLVRVPADQESVSGLPLSMYFYQPDFDRLLRNSATSQSNVVVKLGAEMIGLEQDDHSVRTTVRNADGATEKLETAWLVGCDGAWSPVREATGLPLESLNFDEQWLVLDLLLKSRQPNLPADHVVQVCDPARPHLTTPISHNRQRFEFMFLPGETPEDMQRRENVDRLMAPWIPASSFEVDRSAVYTFHGLVARQWRKGRILIAGDAAHQMPPFLGQGMCSGLRDVSNLAWKLTRVAKGDAPVALLDTYEIERSAHVRKVTQAAIEFGQLVCELDVERAAARDRRLLAHDQPDAERISFGLPRLDRGPLVLEGGGSLFVQPTIDGRRLDDIVGNRFLVLARTSAALGTTADWWRTKLDAYVTTIAELDHPALRASLNRFGSDVVVVRPDRYVLGAAANLDDITRRVSEVIGRP